MTDNKTFGHYQVVEELGRGGMGVVYKAWEPTLDRFVAIKVLADNLAHDESIKQRFIREAKAMATINHPNVIHIHTIGEEDGLPYFAMEFIQGSSLSEILKQGNVLSLPHARNIIYQACKGLLGAHKKGLIHRDIKPDNLMVTDEGLLKVVDFGIALSHNTEEKLTNTGEMVGTPGYVSPEAYIGQLIDKRADIFSLGIVFYEILAGRVPFENDSPLGLMLEVVQAEILDVREVNKKIDKNTSKILKKMLAKSPDERYQNCEQIISDLGKIEENKAIETILTSSIILDPQNIKKNISSDHTTVNSLSKTELSIQSPAPLTKNIPFIVLTSIVFVLGLGWFFINQKTNKEPIKDNVNRISENETNSNNIPNLQRKNVANTQAMVESNLPEDKKQENKDISNSKKSALEEFVQESKEEKAVVNTESLRGVSGKELTSKKTTAETVQAKEVIKNAVSNPPHKKPGLAKQKAPQKTIKQPKRKTATTPTNTKVSNHENNSPYRCIEISKFEVDRTNHKTKALERAAKIPDEVLKQIQFIAVGEIIRDQYGLNALEPDAERCPNNNGSLLLTGRVTDYKKGNKVARYLVGFGAGKQKFQVELTLKEKASEKVLAQGRVIDSKIGGLLGGSAEKGQYDFAEKISGFVRESIGIKADVIQKTKEQI